MKLSTFEDWKNCITVDCKIPLTLDYVEGRITGLSDLKNEHTKKFIEVWGEDHRQTTISWFERAKQELKS